jgi:Ca-activated chloride channel homolog
MTMNLNEFHFIRPYWLLTFIPYIVVLAILVRNKLSHGNWTTVCDKALLPYILQDKVVNNSRWPLVTGIFTGFLAIIALAGPAWERLPTPVFRNDSALVIVLDLSRSMDAADIKPSRLVMARYKIQDILKQRKDGQTALIVYAADAFTVTPLTNDTETIDNQLTAVSTEIMPGDGNYAAKGLEKAKELITQAGLQKGQILLITDGGNTDEAAATAKTLDAFQLLVLGVGTSEGAPIALKDGGGFLKDEQGGIIIDKLDVTGLEKLARAGNGAYQLLSTDDSDIRSLFSTIALQSAEKGEKNENLLLDQWRDAGPYLLLLVLPLAALNFRKGLFSIALILMLPIPKNSYALDTNLVWKDLWQTQDQQAQEAYNNKEYDKAAELFENPDWKAAAHYKSGAFDKSLEELKNTTGADSSYNQGNALAQSGQFKEALEAYKNALKLNPNDEDAKFNKELIEKELEKQKQEQKQDQKNKDKKQESKDQKDQQQNKEGNKPDKSEQDKNQENKEQSKEGEKPEEKSEQSQKDAENQPEKKETEKPQQENKPEAAKPEQAEKPDEKEQPKKPDSANAQPMDSMTAEEKQANEQWLKRIPDDPAGLLKRKFKYQYDQRGRQ